MAPGRIAAVEVGSPAPTVRFDLPRPANVHAARAFTSVRRPSPLGASLRVLRPRTIVLRHFMRPARGRRAPWPHTAPPTFQKTPAASGVFSRRLED